MQTQHFLLSPLNKWLESPPGRGDDQPLLLNFSQFKTIFNIVSICSRDSRNGGGVRLITGLFGVIITGAGWD